MILCFLEIAEGKSLEQKKIILAQNENTKTDEIPGDQAAKEKPSYNTQEEIDDLREEVNSLKKEIAILKALRIGGFFDVSSGCGSIV